MNSESMSSFKVLAMVYLALAMAHCTPVSQSLPQSDLFAGILGGSSLGAQSKESDIVKRRVFEENSDKELKQVSFSSLIGDLEDSLFASAVSVHKVVNANDKFDEVPQVKPGEDGNDVHKSKRHLTTESSTTAATTEASPLIKENHVILQTTEKVPEANGVPAHIIIDRIAIQPHTGGVPLIPTFEIKRTSNNEKPSEITKISITKTEISSVPNTKAPSSTSASTTPSVSVESTTKKHQAHLKEVEEELKEKVAEIEADPVILSARV